MELASIWLAIILMYNVGGNPVVPLYKTASSGPFETQEACVVNVNNIGLSLISERNQPLGYKIIDSYCIEVTDEDSTSLIVGPTT